MLCIPEPLALELKLETEFLREVTVADGRSMTVPYVGPVKVAFGDRLCFDGWYINVKKSWCNYWIISKLLQ